MTVRKALIVMMLTAHSKSNSPLVNKCFTIIQTHSISIALAHLSGTSSEHETSESDTEGYEFYFKLVKPRLIPHSVFTIRSTSDSGSESDQRDHLSHASDTRTYIGQYTMSHT